MVAYTVPLFDIRYSFQKKFKDTEEERDVVDEMTKIYFMTHSFNPQDISKISETLKQLEKDVESAAFQES
jgi:hypothetical protein